MGDEEDLECFPKMSVAINLEYIERVIMPHVKGLQPVSIQSKPFIRMIVKLMTGFRELVKV